MHELSVVSNIDYHQESETKYVLVACSLCRPQNIYVVCFDNDVVIGTKILMLPLKLMCSW